MKTPRVLIVTSEAPDCSPGGLGFFNQILWQELKRQNFTFRTLYIYSKATPPSRLTDYQVSAEGALPFDSTLESQVMNQFWTIRNCIQPILDEYQPDIISVHESRSVLPFYFELKKVQFSLHFGYIGMEHYLTRTQAGLQYYWEQRIALRQAGAVVMHSEWTDRMVQKYVASDRVKPYIFPIGLDQNEYPERKQFHSEGKIVISFFGRFNDTIKNFDVLRQAILMLSPEFRARIEPRIYGPGQLPEEWETEGFKGFGYVQGEAKKQAFAQTDIVVMPSTHETFGIVGLEALLSNCALIATAGLGMDFYMPKDCSCAPNSVAIRDRLIHYIQHFDEIRQKQLTQYYRRLVSQPEFTVSCMTVNYINVWETLAKKMGYSR